MKNIVSILLLFVVLPFVFNACSEPINIFSVQQDKDFGKAIDEAINNRPDLFPILNESQYSEAYIYLYAMRDDILIAPQINFKDRYEWQLKIIDNDSVVNAFCNPGGYIYIYTGLLKFMDKSDYVAGLVAQMIAQCDQRQTIASLTNLYGTQKLMAVANNTASAEDIDNIMEQMTALYYDIDQKKIADNYAVDYLRITKYACNSTALMMQHFNQSSQQSTLYSNTYAPFQNRIDQISTIVSDYGCSVDTWHSLGDNGDYAAMIATLP